MKLSGCTSRLPILVLSIILTLLSLVLQVPPPVAADDSPSATLWNFQLNRQTFIPLYGITAFDTGTSGGGGASHNLAIDKDRNVWSWGYNSQGQLGVGNQNNLMGHYKVLGKDSSGYLADVTAVSAGNGFSLALKSNGTVWAWGGNYVGQLGIGSSGYGYYGVKGPDFIATPVQVSGLPSSIIAISAGESHSLALDSTGMVWAWGANYYGQVGVDIASTDNGGTNYIRFHSTVPVQVGLSEIKSISAGGHSSMALDEAGNVWNWGNNSWGQLGQGDKTNRTSPVKVKGVGGTGFLGNISLISAGYSHSLAFGPGGGSFNVYAWGSNYSGALGDETTTERWTPIVTASLPSGTEGGVPGGGTISISAGMNNSLVKNLSGSITAWGEGFGTLGYFGNYGVSPVLLDTIHDATVISAGGICLVLGPARSASSVTVQSSINPSHVGDDDVTFYATVAVTSGYPATGGVDFYLNNGIGNLPASLNAEGTATYSIPWDWFAPGMNNQIVAKYNGDYNNAPSTSPDYWQLVKKLDSTTTFVSSANPSYDGESVTFTATVSGPAGKPIPTGSVSFSDGLFGSFNLVDGQVEFTNSALPVGTTSIAASYSGDTRYNSSNSTVLEHLVRGGVPPKLVSGNSPWTDSGVDLKAGDRVSITAEGSIYFADYGGYYGPDGTGNYDASAYIDAGLHFQSLVGSIGDPTVISPPAYFQIGDSYIFTASADGRLWLGVNAATFDDNTGSWNVTIRVTPPAGPVINQKSVKGVDKWTDSGVDFKTGDFVAIVASGEVNFYYAQYGSSYPYGPDGADYSDSSASIDPNLPFWSLVGSTGDPLTLSPPAFFGIGGAYYFNAVEDGHLWLGVNAAEFADNSGSWDVTVTVTPASIVFEPVAMTTTSPLQEGTAGVAYGPHIIGTTGGSGDFTWSWWNTYDPIPDWLNLDPATGTLSGTPTKAGNYNVPIKVHDKVYGMDVRQNFTLKVNAAVRMTTLWLPDGVKTAAYSENMNAAYGNPPYTWKIVSGGLPSGLTLTGNTISGTPDASGVYSFTTQVEDALGITDSRNLTINILDPVLKIVTTALLPGAVGQEYNQTLHGAYATSSLEWTLSSGSLPPGLNLDGSGNITGKPTIAGRYPFVIKLTSGSVAVNQDFFIQVNAPGKILAWGYGINGQLGTGEKISYDTPVQTSSSSGLTAAVSVDAGSIHSLAVDTDGTVWSWGQGGNGQLAQSTAGWQNPFPGKVEKTTGGNLGDVVVISAGNLQGGMAINKAGRLLVWGDNQQGQLGNGAPSYTRNSADEVPGLTNVVAVSSSKSGYHSLAVTAGGLVWGWGWNNSGQVGNGDFTPDGTDIHTSTPSRVQGLTDIVAVAAGYDHSLALDKSGRVWAWGSNSSGQLGLGTVDYSYSAHLLPALVPGLSNITAISAGPAYSIALDSNGHIWAWGFNAGSVLGLGHNSSPISSPTKIPSLAGILSISAGSNFVVALDNNGRVWTWGNGNSGQLGDGNSGSGNFATPRLLGSLNGIRAVAGGNLHAMAVSITNGDSDMTIADAILALRVLSAIPPNPQETINKDAALSASSRIGLAEAIYIMQKVAETR